LISGIKSDYSHIFARQTATIIHTMASPDHSFKQYNSLINWPNQENTSINIMLNEFIIKQVICKKRGRALSLYDIGFGIGVLFRMLETGLPKRFKTIHFEGCEPSQKNYSHFAARPFKRESIHIETDEKPFLETTAKRKFDFVTAIYVFPHFGSDELDEVAVKTWSMLKKSGRFIMAVTNEQYLEEKLANHPEQLIEARAFVHGGIAYKEILHYSDIPKIGLIVDCNREERFYPELFARHGFKLDSRTVLNDMGFVCSLFVFSKIS
jgi:2-polyprenyl-3-methyl-5-hydroxy-6-metoxy-1,4-benzoquinol methylase